MRQDVCLDENCLCALQEQVVPIEINTLETSYRIFAGPKVGQVRV
jgi:hypothetical protein